MSDEKDDSPSAEELLDDMSEAEDEEASGEDEGMSQETMDELGGLFGVSSGESEESGAESGGGSAPESDETSPDDPSDSGGARFDPATASDELDAVDPSDESDEAGGETSDAETVQMSADAAEAIAQSGEFDSVEKEQLRGKLKELAADAGDEELAEQIESLAGGGDSEEANVEAPPEETDSGGAESGSAAADDVPEEDAGGTESTEAMAASSASDRDDGTVGGVFSPSGSGGGDVEADLDDAYLDEGDLGEYEDDDSTSSTIFLVGGGIALLLTVGIVALFAFTDQGKRLAYLLKGDLKEYELQKTKQEEKQLAQKQREIIDGAPKIGTLRMTGEPRYADITVDGEALYAQTPKSKHWRRIRLEPDTQFPVFRVGEKHEIVVSAPGWKQKKVTLTKGMWNPIGGSVPSLDNAALKYEKRLDVTLDPKTPAHQTEFLKRMEKDAENNYYGKVKITSRPEGAKIIFNNKPLLNEKGEEVTTPATFEKRYYENEKTGKIEEEKIKVDTAKHHKVVLEMPDDAAEKEYPSFVTPVKRQMWKCTWKEDKEPKNPAPEKCNYSFELDVDFEALSTFAKERDKERKEIKKELDEAREEVNALATEKSKSKKGKAGSKGKGK